MKTVTWSGHTADHLPGCPQQKPMFSSHRWVLNAAGQPSAFLRPRSLPLSSISRFSTLLPSLFFSSAQSLNTFNYSQAVTISITSLRVPTKTTSPLLSPLPGTHSASSNLASCVYLARAFPHLVPGPIKWRQPSLTVPFP